MLQINRNIDYLFFSAELAEACISDSYHIFTTSNVFRAIKKDVLLKIFWMSQMQQ